MSDTAEPPNSLSPVATAGRSFTPQQRIEFDRRALGLQPKQLTPSKLEFYGDLTGWLVSRAPLPEKEETDRLLEAHRQRMESSPSVPARGLELIVLSELEAALPIRMQPLVDEFVVKVLETDEFVSDTVGSPYIYLSRAFVDACVADQLSGKERLAFALAHELGHIIRGHCRRRHQLMWFAQLIEKGVDIKLSPQKIEDVLRRTVAVSNHSLRFLASLDEDFQADLFAVHLCRNAGYDVDKSLDLIRSFASPTDETDPNDPQGSTLRALLRLQRLKMDVDGRVYHHKTRLGLFEYDRATGQRTIVDDEALLGVEQALICLHGMESDLAKFDVLYAELAGSLPENIRLLGLQHPGDGSLSCAGEFLTNELQRTSANTEKFDFVCHSAGGLVLRYYAEVKQNRIGRAIFISTPHFGSDLSHLRPLLEAKQFFGNLKIGYDDAVEQAITDGKGQITWDLLPYSLFLSYLNRPEHPRSPRRYFTINGRALSPLKGLLLHTSVVAIRKSLQRVLSGMPETSALRRSVHEWASKLVLPDEITRGDLAVSLASSSLEDTADETTFEVTHSKMPMDPSVVRHIVDLLHRPPPDELDLLMP